MSQRIIRVWLSVLIISLCVAIAEAQQNSFTYQGKLTDNGAPANGNYDLKFALFDSSLGGSEVKPPQTVTNVAVSAGLFTVTLDFGPAAFAGPPRFLEISARPSGAGSFTLLTPRQQVTSTPYAVRSASSGAADIAANASQLGGLDASQYVQASDARLSDARPPAAGSGNYIQNSTSPQSLSNFNISGNGKADTFSANVVNATTQYNLNGNRAFAIIGTNQFPNTNTFAGVGTGTLTSPGSSGGHDNSFFGFRAGTANTIGSANSFFGKDAGVATTTGVHNSFFGNQAGFFNTTGEENSFFGDWAGFSNTSGYLNSFFGHRAGWKNTSGSFNVVVGYDAAQVNTTGNWNSFVGTAAGWSNLTGSFNSYLGYDADGAADISNSTAIGARAKVTQSNSLVLGSVNGINGATADTTVGIGTTAPAFKLQVVDPSNTGLRVQTNTAGGTVGSFGSLGDFNVDSNGVVGGRFTVKENGNIGIGTSVPDAKLDVAGKIRFASLGEAGNVQLCRNSNGEISNCSSSLRYKTSLHPYAGGLNLINRLHPITFKWKADQSLDLGLGAEDVAAIEPLLVTRGKNGEVEGVKYDRLSAVFINAFKEQQTQIERQQAEINELKKLLCSMQPQAGVCK